MHTVCEMWPMVMRRLYWNVIAMSVLGGIIVAGIALSAVGAYCEVKNGRADMFLPTVVSEVLPARKIPGCCLFEVSVSNDGLHDKWLINMGHKDKTKEFVFEPVRVEWYKGEQMVHSEMTVLQVSIHVPAGESKDILILSRFPDQPAQYVVKVFLAALEGTSNSVVPAGFQCETRVSVTARGVQMLKSE